MTCFEEVTVESPASEGLLIQNATLIDVVSGKAIPDSHLLVSDGIIVGIMVGTETESLESVAVYDARDRYVMPGLFDVHVHLTMHPHLLTGDFGPLDELTARVALEQFVRIL